MRLTTAHYYTPNGRQIHKKGIDPDIPVYVTPRQWRKAQIRRAHIRVELIYLRMGPRVQAAMDVFADLAAITFFGLMLWQAINEAEYSLQIKEATVGLIRFPLYPARIILAAGTGLLILRLVLDVIVDATRIYTGAPPPNVDPNDGPNDGSDMAQSDGTGQGGGTDA